MKTQVRARSALCVMCLALVVVGVLASSVAAAGPGLHGWVYSQTKEGKVTGTVPGAKIEFKDQGGSVVQTVTADKRGYYKANLSPGTYYYKVTAAGYKDEDEGRGVRVVQGDKTEWYNFALMKGENDPDREPPVLPDVKIGRLFGRVLEKTPDGLIGIPGAVITLNPVGAVAPVQVTSSTASGRDVADGDYEVFLAAGGWRASVNAPGFDLFVDPDPIVMVAGEDTERDFVLARPQPDPDEEQGIRGMVTILKPPKPCPDATIDFFPLPGNQSVAQQTITKWQSVSRIDAARNKYQQPLFPGRFRVVATAEGCRSASRVADVIPGRWTRVDLTLRPLEEDENDDGKFNVTINVITPTGNARPPVEPVASAMVQLVRVPGILNGMTSKSGVAKFQCRQGRWKVAAQKTGLLQVEPVFCDVGPGLPNEATVVLVKEDEIPEPEPDEGYDILVRVTDVKFTPIAGANTVVGGQGPTLRETTDEQGMSDFEVEKTGAYSAAAIAPGYKPGGEKFVVKDPKTAVHIILAREAEPVLTRDAVHETVCPAIATRCPPVPTSCPGGATQCPISDTMCPRMLTHCPPERTRCQAVSTACRPGATFCPAVRTVCPRFDTNCPEVRTKCPPHILTRSPGGVTRCPAIRTKCPPTPTLCALGATRCPPVKTICPASTTRCPAEETICCAVPAATRCPAIETVCTHVATKCPQEETRCWGQAARTRCPAAPTMCMKKPTRCPPSETRCPPCELTRDAVSTTKCPAVRTKCPESRTTCPICPETQYPIELTKCPKRRTRCPSCTLETRYPVVATKCPRCELETRSPMVRTQCPAERTTCPPCPGETRTPVVPTKCPRCEFETRYPIKRTQCPAERTTCPPCPGETRTPVVPTRCPRCEFETRYPIKRTQCPAERTTCPPCPGETRTPVVPTRCPRCEFETRSPIKPTQCPAIRTRCPACPSETRTPVVPTRCPRCEFETRSPVRRTQCPAIRTVCPMCETPRPTVSPSVYTRCPINATTCPPKPTRCPPVPTACPPCERRTVSPPRPTICPPCSRETVSPAVLTRCPQIRTRCPSCGGGPGGRRTISPSVPTQCPPRRTICPRCSIPPRGIDTPRRPLDTGPTSVTPSAGAVSEPRSIPNINTRLPAATP